MTQSSSARRESGTKSTISPVTGFEAEVGLDRLPGAVRAYAMRDGAGSHYLVGGQVATVIARGIDTGGLFEAAVLAGGMGATLTARRHRAADAGLLVLDGQVELMLDGRAHLLSRGDYAVVPAGTVYAHRFAAHRARLLVFTLGEEVGAMYPALGTPFSRPVPPENVTLAIGADRLAVAEAEADVSFAAAGGSDFAGAVPVTAERLPGERRAYVLGAGEGERLVAANQVFSFLSTGAETHGRFIAVMTEGPAGEMIVPHFHAEHTENFLCLDGLMTMVVNGHELHLHPGDYLQVPSRHVHAYRLDSPYTRFFGWLTPGVFEPFFRLIGEPYQPHVFPLKPGPLRFDRVMANIDSLDLHPVGRKDALA